MSVFKKDTIIDSCPAYDIVTREKDSYRHINITAGDTLHDNHGIHQVGSVVSSALENNNDPMVDVKRAEGFGHDLHFIFAKASILTSHRLLPSERKTHLAVDFDAVYRFEGNLFTIQRTANRNLGFVKFFSPKHS